MPRSLNKIKLKDIHLTLWNPRFEIINSPEFDYISKILKEDSNYNDEKELETIIKLFSEDEKIFKELFHSINLDFIPENEEIQLIYNKKSRKYIVFDGNRRISCLKIFQNINKYMKKLEPYSKNYAFGSTYYQNKKNFYQFLKEINKNINEIISELYEKQFKIFNDNKTIHRLLFKKHSSGDLVGFKPWNKSKYYLDLFSMFKNKGWLLKEDLKKIEVEIIANFNKTPSQLYKDYTSACWIIQVFSDISKQNEEIYNDIIAIKPSAFEINFIKSTINYCIDLIKNNRFENIKIENYFNLSFKKELRCWVNEGGWEINSIIQFIKKLKDEKIQITNDLNPKQKNQLKELFLIHLNINNIIIDTDKEFINIFSFWNIDELMQIQDHKWLKQHKNKENIIFLVKQRIGEIKIINAIVDDLKFKESDLILELSNQMLHNFFDSNIFSINTIIHSINTIYEYIIRLIILQCFENINAQKRKNKKNNEFYSANKINDFYNFFSDGKTKLKYEKKINRYDLLTNLLTDFKIDKNNQYYNFFKNIMGSNKKDKIFKSKIFNDAYKFFFNDHYDINEFKIFADNYWLRTNFFIHKVYIKNFENTIKIFSNTLSQRIEILKKFQDIVWNLKKGYINNFIKSINRFEDSLSKLKDTS